MLYIRMRPHQRQFLQDLQTETNITHLALKGGWEEIKNFNYGNLSSPTFVNVVKPLI